MNKKLTNFILELFLGLALGGLFSGVSFFYIGFHNLDLAHNMEMVSKYEDFDLEKYCDITNKGNCIKYKYAYTQGLKQMVLGLKFVFLSTLILGFILNSLMEKKNLYEINFCGNCGRKVK